MTRDLSKFEGHWMQVCSDEKVKEVCNKIVANFDGEFLEPERIGWETLRQKLN